ncbi:MAG: hypothetical protein PF447_02750 [Spirochaetaceae bacterium]|jgi:hypothetical protein|nr:hypothetical protein [Spirochaetaceae bacterium]
MLWGQSLEESYWTWTPESTDIEGQLYLNLQAQGKCLWLYLDDNNSTQNSLREEEWYRAREDLVIIQNYMREFLPLKIDSDNGILIARGPLKGSFVEISREEFLALQDKINNVSQ